MSAQEPEKSRGVHRHQPRPVTALVRHHRRLGFAISPRLVHRIFDVQALDGLYFKMEKGKFIADDIWRISAAGILLAASRVITIGTQFVAPLPFTALSFFPAIHISVVQLFDLSDFSFRSLSQVLIVQMMNVHIATT